MKNKNDLIEIFGYAPDDTTKAARSLWKMGACPFIKSKCIKINHDQSITYGTCSVTSPYGDIIICPNRLYANNYESISRIAKDAFEQGIPLYFFDEYIENREKIDKCIVAIGQNSGKEIQVGKSLSMDWVLVLIDSSSLIEYVGIEVQSIDITGNYRDAWHAYNRLGQKKKVSSIPSSKHGLNWANVHKRLIPQLIRKGIVYSRSNICKKGMYFIIPDIVYKKFEDVIGSDIPIVEQPNKNTITVFAYSLGPIAGHGEQRSIVVSRKIRFTLDEFSNRFITGPNLPSGEELDDAIMRKLGIYTDSD